MLQQIRKTINANRLYSWMAAFIILVYAYVLLVQGLKPAPERESGLRREEFKLELEKRKEILQDIVERDTQLAMNLGYITLFILIVLITGSVFFVDYFVKKKRDNIEPLPKTLDAPVPLWGLGDVAKVIILFLFFNHLFSVSAHILSNLFPTPGLDRRTATVAATLLMDILVLMFVLRIILKHRQSISALGISIKNLLRNLGIALYAYVSFLPLLAVIFLGIVAVTKALNYTPPPEPIYELIFKEERPFVLLVISALVSLIGPVIEEIFFRGFFYAALKKSLGVAWAISLSAFFFSLLHTNVIGFVPILALGMFLAYLKEKTGSLIPSITVHIVHNTILTALMFFARGLTSKII